MITCKLEYQSDGIREEFNFQTTDSPVKVLAAMENLAQKLAEGNVKVDFGHDKVIISSVSIGKVKVFILTNQNEQRELTGLTIPHDPVEFATHASNIIKETHRQTVKLSEQRVARREEVFRFFREHTI